jgi:hypothetical protein
MADTVENRPVPLTFFRTSVGDVGERQVVVRIDGGDARNLYFGDSLTVELPPGDHRVRVHNTLVWRTLTVTLAPGEPRAFDILNYAPPFALGLLAIVGAGPLLLKVTPRGADGSRGAEASEAS